MLASASIFPAADDFERFRKKARTFLHEHRADAAIDKIRRNQLVTAELQRKAVAIGRRFGQLVIFSIDEDGARVLDCR